MCSRTLLLATNGIDPLQSSLKVVPLGMRPGYEFVDISVIPLQRPPFPKGSAFIREIRGKNRF